MNGRKYIIAIFFTFIAIFFCVIHYINVYVISQGVDEIEIKQTYDDMVQLNSLLDAAKIRLHQHAYDWAVWDDAYTFVAHKNNNFIGVYLNKDRIKELDISAVGFFDLNGDHISFIDGSNLEFGEEWVDNEFNTFGRIAKMLHRHHLESIEGFLNVSGVSMIIAAHRVYNSTKTSPPNGYLVMSVAINEQFIAKTKRFSGLEFSTLPISVFNHIYAPLIKDSTAKFLQTENEVRVYSIVNDIFTEPAFCLELKRSRDTAAFGKRISQKNFWLTLLLCISILLAGLYTLALAHRRFLRDEYDYKAKHDSLTGLPNSILLLERLESIRNDAHKRKLNIGVAYLDLDHFKSVNDSYGYQAGDTILKETANRLLEVPGASLVSRTSVDNFQIVFVEKDIATINRRTESIMDLMNEPFSAKGNSIHIGTSIGLAYLDNEKHRILDLVHHAELAMNDAKNQGGGTISIYDPSMREAAGNRLKIETALYDAVEQGNLLVHYQPKIDIEKCDVAGCEALVRWKTDEGKWIPPSVFVPIAEDTGLITRIDMFVLRTACRQVLAWKENGSGAVPIAVNMSVRSILSEGFADQVIRILEEEGTPPSLIDIEITETSFMSDIDTAFAAISRLHESGLQIALDDFGTGYSSLQYLSAMPISFLKIDKKFVDDIFSGKITAQPLVKSIISLANNLGMHTVSEGVEDQQQLCFLAANGAHIIQGYLFSKPLSPEDCTAFLRTRKERILTVLQAA